MISLWYRIQRTHLRSPVRTLSFRDGCEWSGQGRTAGQKEGDAGCRATVSTEVPATGVAQKGGALRPRVYRHDLANERESIRSVVVIPSDSEQPEVSPEQQGSGPSGSRDRMTLVGPVASPITSLPRTPGRDILLPGDAEESPRTREGRVVAATLEQEIGRRSVAGAIRPIKDRAVASSSSATEPITQEMVAEACDTLVRERHPASPPVWPEGSEPPTQSDPDRTRGTKILQEPPLPRRKTASTPRPYQGGSPRGAEQGPAPCLVRAQSSDKRNSCRCAPTFQRPRSQRVTRAANQGTGKARKRIHPTWWRDFHRT